MPKGLALRNGIRKTGKMSSREEILANIRKLELKERPLPEIPDFAHPEDLVAQFKASLEANNATIIICSSEKEAKKAIEDLAGSFTAVVSRVPQFGFSSIDLAKISHPAELHQLELAIVEGEIGVAENGASWIPEENLGVRALPFISLHLAIVLKKEKLVANMHEAYKKLGPVPGFGTFIAGPSKTADIEQALVIGAHGPKSLVVVVF